MCVLSAYTHTNILYWYAYTQTYTHMHTHTHRLSGTYCLACKVRLCCQGDPKNWTRLCQCTGGHPKGRVTMVTSWELLILCTSWHVLCRIRHTHMWQSRVAKLNIIPLHVSIALPCSKHWSVELPLRAGLICAVQMHEYLTCLCSVYEPHPPCYNVSNAVMQSKYAAEWCSISTWDCHICHFTVIPTRME